jgi:hypothetical protein
MNCAKNYQQPDAYQKIIILKRNPVIISAPSADAPMFVCGVNLEK